MTTETRASGQVVKRMVTRVDLELYNTLRVEAAREQKTVNGVVVELIEKWIKKRVGR